jgi:hypothetical protein
MSLLGERFRPPGAPQTDADQAESALDFLPPSAKDRIKVRFGDLTQDDIAALQSLVPLFKEAKKNLRMLPMFAEKELEKTRIKNGIPFLPAKDVELATGDKKTEPMEGELDHHFIEARYIIKERKELEDEEVEEVLTNFRERFQDATITDYLPTLASKAATEAARKKLAKQQNTAPQSDTPSFSPNKQSPVEAHNNSAVESDAIPRRGILFKKPKNPAKKG